VVQPQGLSMPANSVLEIIGVELLVFSPSFGRGAASSTTRCTGEWRRRAPFVRSRGFLSARPSLKDNEAATFADMLERLSASLS